MAAIGAVLILLTVAGVRDIDPSGQYRAFSGTTISFALAMVPLLLILSLLGGISVLL